MRNKSKLKIIIMALGIGFILLLSFSFILQGTDIIISEQDDNINRNVVRPLTASKLVIDEWNRTWGGGSIDSSLRVVVDSSGNIYLAGYTESFGVGGVDMVLVKYDGNGVQQWNRTWGGGSNDYGFGVAVDSLGNIYLAGRTVSFGVGLEEMVLVKYDGNGVQQWNRTWGGNRDDLGYGVAVDLLDNIYLTGYSRSFGAGYSDMVLVKYDGNGVQQWNRTWGGPTEDYCYGVAVDSSGNIYLAGSRYIFAEGSNYMVLVKYDGNGVEQWYRTWGGSGDDYGYEAVVDSSDNIYLVGYTPSFGAGGRDMVLVKYDGNGVQQWNRTWGGNNNDYSFGAAMDSSSNIYLAGQTESFGAGGVDMVLVKYDRNGVQQWNHTWGGPGSDGGRGAAVDSSGNIYFAGGTSSFGAGLSDMVLVKYIPWYPMPNLKVSHFSSVVAYKRTSFVLDFSVTNNGIWKAEGVIIIVRCEELDLTFFNNTNSPLTLDIDETEYIAINCPPIGQPGTFELNLTVDPDNIIDETYSSKDGYPRKDAENDNSQTAELTILPETLNLAIISQTFSTKNFNISFFVYDDSGQYIDFATIQLMWNNTDVSADVQNLGNGLYFISLESITVTPGEEPILLNMIISASGYEDKYFETYIAVDPASLLKGEGRPTDGFPLALIIIISAIGAGAIIGLISIYWLRKRKIKTQ